MVTNDSEWHLIYMVSSYVVFFPMVPMTSLLSVDGES